MGKEHTEYLTKQALTALDNLAEKYLPSWEGGAAVAARSAIIYLQDIIAKAAVDYERTIIARDQARAEIDYLTKERDALQVSLDALHGHTFSERVYCGMLAKIDDLRADLADARNGWESAADELRRCDAELRAVQALQDVVIAERNKAAAELDKALHDHADLSCANYDLTRERDALLRGEYICTKCGLRKNSDTDEKQEF